MSRTPNDSGRSAEPAALGPLPIDLGLFLASAVILFGAILSSYVVLRVNDPDAFTYAPGLLDRRIDAITVASLVVVCLAAASSVRFALAEKVGPARALLGVALLAGAAVLAARAVEFPATSRRAGFLSSPNDVATTAAHTPHAEVAPAAAAASAAAATPVAQVPSADQPQIVDGELRVPHSALPAGSAGPAGAVRDTVRLQKSGGEGRSAASIRRFFSFVLLVTGLHSLYVIFGLVLGTWLLVTTTTARSSKITLAAAAAYWAVIGAIGVLLIPTFYV